MVVVEPAFQVDRIEAWNQTAILEDMQFGWSIMTCSDDLVEGVLQSYGVIMCSLVLQINTIGE